MRTGMTGEVVQIQLVTVDDCRGGPCAQCMAAEGLLRRILRLGGMELPPHEEAGAREVYLDGRRMVEVAHVSTSVARRQGLDPDRAPYLFVDGEKVLDARDWSRRDLAEHVFDALYPRGMADLRP